MRARRPTKSMSERLLGKCIPEPNTGCWLWTACLTPQGYGKLTVQHRTVVASRAAYEAFIGPIPPDMFVCHRCDVRACINPSHLFVGTRQDNMDDMVRKGRSPLGERNASSRKTACPRGHPYSGVYLGQRVCRPCARAASRRYEERLREARGTQEAA